MPAPVAMPVAVPPVAVPPVAVAPVPAAPVAPTAAPATVAFTKPDDLKRIRAIDAVLETSLNRLGVRRYSEIAAWKPEDITRINRELGFKERIEQENWIEQSQILARGEETFFSRRLARGEMPNAIPVADEGERTSVAAPVVPAQVVPAPADQATPMRSRSGVEAAAAAAAAMAAAAAVSRTAPEAPALAAVKAAAPAAVIAPVVAAVERTVAAPVAAAAPLAPAALPAAVSERAAFADRPAASGTASTTVATPSAAAASPPASAITVARPVAPAAAAPIPVTAPPAAAIPVATAAAVTAATAAAAAVAAKLLPVAPATTTASAIPPAAAATAKVAPQVTPTDVAAVAAPAATAQTTAASSAIGTGRENLQRIGGINSEVEKLLNVQGISRYSQIAHWGKPETERFDRLLGYQGRISRENWIEQAQILGKGGDTAYSREFDRRTAESEMKAAEPPRPTRLADAIRVNESKPAEVRPRNDLSSLRSVRSEAFRQPEQAAAVPASSRADSSSAARVRSAVPEDLKRIRGVGVLIEKKLNSMGVTNYDQVANWSAGDIERVSQVLDFKGRIERENWVEQARILAAGGQTEFSRRADRGDIDPSRG